VKTSGVIDAHVHAYPAEVAAGPAAWGAGHGEPGWTRVVAPEGRRSVQGWADPDRLVADMDEARVDACVMLGWYWERQETCDLQNGWYLEWMGRHPKRLIGFATVQPAQGARAVDALERALDSGLCGVGELLPQAQGYALGDRWFRRVMEIAVDRRIPITLHATDPGAGAAAGPATPPEGFIRLAKDYPGAAIILAHWGGGLAFRGAPGGEPLPSNLYFDTAASPLLYGSGVFRQAVGRVGAGNILYGSDYPLILHPRATREPGFGRFLGEIDGAGLDPSEREQVLGSNMRRLLSPGLALAQKRV
jgi:predicted TIM-barrel fold metal-dependent hydrolase